MKVNFKKAAVSLFLAGTVSVVNAAVCNNVPGSVICGSGTVESLMGNGTVTVNGTTVSKNTLINGLLYAEDANFNSLTVNGSAKFVQCTVNDVSNIRGSLSASSTKFERSLEVFSSEARFINSKVGSDLHMGHTDASKQIVYLDNFSEVAGNIIFDDGNGEVILRGQSKVGGKVIGGHTVANNN